MWQVVHKEEGHGCSGLVYLVRTSGFTLPLVTGPVTAVTGLTGPTR
jgi:hypothetical protein